MVAALPQLRSRPSCWSTGSRPRSAASMAQAMLAEVEIVSSP